ncbi:hypothetical protein DL546_004993 [Coniochaeta pulveracea]|uniref:Uncharacterized protein n=1 Tax=Coniochaeta pulveracea TaxID=177199 RepID=A0A420Y7X3_9PEZI|nr:hypothetical protein DL546_004993 [Coniochaeta pulveracea]
MSDPPLLFGKPRRDEASNPSESFGLNGTTAPKQQCLGQPKRRGRPPGRPNKIKDGEMDFESNPSVRLWNTHYVPTPIPAVAINIRLALSESSLTRDAQRAIFRLPSREYIHFAQGWITARHIASNRPSYVNGLLIHSRGNDSPTACTQCAEKRGKNALGPFLVCRVLRAPNRKRKKGGGTEGAKEGDEDVVAQSDRTSGLDDLGSTAVDPTLVSSDMFLAELAVAAAADELEESDGTLLRGESLQSTGTT